MNYEEYILTGKPLEGENLYTFDCQEEEDLYYDMLFEEMCMLEQQMFENDLMYI